MFEIDVWHMSILAHCIRDLIPHSNNSNNGNDRWTITTTTEDDKGRKDFYKRVLMMILSSYRYFQIVLRSCLPSSHGI